MAGTASFDFTGNVVLITVGGTGIGAGLATAFAQANAAVVITGRRLEPLQATAALFPDRISYVQMDVANDDDRRHTIEALLSRHGRLDVLINNALSLAMGPFETHPPSGISDMYRVLLEAPTEFIRQP